MKRKVTAAITSLALLFGGAVPVMAEGAAVSSPAEVGNTASDTQLSREEITAMVKSRIEIPEDYTEFTMDSSTGSDGSVVYRLSWEPVENVSHGDISVSADEKGRILSYNRYIRYDSYSGSMVSDSRDSVIAQMTETVQTMLPECFTESDTYTLDASTFNMDGSGTAAYMRYKDGIKVWGNEIHIRFVKSDGEYVITELDSSHDYDAQFGENTDGENIAERYRELAAGKLQYNLIYDYDDENGSTRTPVLRYVITDAPFMDPVTGEEIIEDTEAPYLINSPGGSGGSSAEAAADSTMREELTPEELEEIINLNSLMTVDEVTAELKAIPELAINDDMTVGSSRIYKTDDKYYMFLSFENDSEGDDYSYRGVTVNAQNGKLVDFYGNGDYYAYSSENEMTEEELAEVSGEEFLTKYADGFEDYSITNKSGYKSEITRVHEYYNKNINGIPYTGATAQITYNADTGEVYSMSIVETIPDGEFPDTDDAISYETAFDTLTSVYPLTPVFVKSDGVYKKAYVLPSRSSYVDAIENMVVNSWDNTPIGVSETIYTYDDISGHWAENMINQFGQFGIGFEGGSFRPDEYITAGDFIKLTEAVVSGRGYAVPITESLGFGENGNDYDETALITREKAVTAIIKCVGYSEVAELEGIFVTGFADEDQISPECLGSCAIAKGMGIISGSGGNFNPKQNVTRAEAISMLYNYKINN